MPFDLVSFARQLIDIDSTTGQEAAAGAALALQLRGLGYRVTEQAVEGTRHNIIATRVDRPDVVFSTHYDCVPPFFASEIREDDLFGRGSCDAKGILAAQIAAAERLHEHGEDRVGLLFVVGEERGSDGARAANEAPIGSRFLVDGEPTGNKLAAATRGALRVKFIASGRAAHSAYPERGESAVEKLIDILTALRSVPLPSDPIMGKTTYSVGLISGGIAPNVVPPSAEAEIMFRTVGPAPVLYAALVPLLRFVRLQPVLDIPAVPLTTVPGFATESFPFTTDIPFLGAWGQPLLIGPGSIHMAHIADEHIAIADLHEAVRLYVLLAERLLAS